MISAIEDQRVCLVCGVSMPRPLLAAGAKTCGDECRAQRAREEQKAWRLRQPPIAAVCVECGGEFLATGGRGRPRKTCGPVCAGKWAVRREKKAYDSRPLNQHYCKICGKAWESRKRKEKCSECRSKYGTPLRQVVCSECETTFTTSNTVQFTCSAQCSMRRRRRVDKARRRKAAEQWRGKGHGDGRGGQTTIHADEIRKIGNSAEAMFDLLCAQRGWVNAEPKGASGCPGFDRVIDRGHGWETVQVKGIGNKQGNKSGKVQLKTSCSGRYADGSFDLLAVIDTASGDAWLVPFGVLNGRKWWYPARDWPEYSTHVLHDSPANQGANNESE